jgi:hypothetical protein
VWRSRTPDGVRCAHFPSVITTIMDQKVQLINPLNLGEVVCGVAEPNYIIAKHCSNLHIQDV